MRKEVSESMTLSRNLQRRGGAPSRRGAGVGNSQWTEGSERVLPCLGAVAQQCDPESLGQRAPRGP